MAERRMFSKNLIERDAFTELPLTAQALYFHLGLRADDDGFCDRPKNTLKMIGATEDDLHVLIVTGFLWQFPSGVVVDMYWPANNNVRKDRYSPTIYTEERDMLEVVEDKMYRLKEFPQTDDQAVTDDIPSDNQVATTCQPTDDQAVTDGYENAPQVRLGKVRLGKDRDCDDMRTHAYSEPDVDYKDYNPDVDVGTEYYQNHIRMMKNIDERERIKDLILQHGLQRFKECVDIAKENGGRSLNYVESVCRNYRPPGNTGRKNRKNDAQAGFAKAMEILQNDE